MAGTFYLEIITPERKFFSDDVQAISLRASDGEVGILNGHQPMVMAVDIGVIRIIKRGVCMEAVLSSGFMEIKQDKTVILVDTAEWPDEIDINRARSAMIRAEERLHSKISRLEYYRSQKALAKALARLKVTKDIT